MLPGRTAQRLLEIANGSAGTASFRFERRGAISSPSIAMLSSSSGSLRNRARLLSDASEADASLREADASLRKADASLREADASLREADASLRGPRWARRLLEDGVEVAVELGREVEEVRREIAVRIRQPPAYRQIMLGPLDDACRCLPRVL